MSYFSLVFILLSTICNVMAEVRVGLGEEVTVTFTGPQLHIEIDNNHKSSGEMFVMCFKSYPNSQARRCPVGYASLYYETSNIGVTYRYFINRHNGQLRDTSLTAVFGKILFGEDGSVTLLVYKLPSVCTLRLVNAVKVVPTTTTTTTEKITTTMANVKEASYKTVFLVTGGLALLFILIIAIALAIICWLR